jgi:hypothetical protein
VSPLGIPKDQLVLLNSKIEKVKSNCTDIFEIKPFAEKIIDSDFGKPAKNPEDYNRRFKIGQELVNKVTEFLDKNDIDISLADVIEY